MDALVVTYPHISTGFRLSGVEVREVGKGEDVPLLFEGILKENRYGLVIIEETLLEYLPEPLRRRIEKSGKPIVIPINTQVSREVEEGVEGYITWLIRRAIGYSIKIKR